jgi:hypothetical protein
MEPFCIICTWTQLMPEAGELPEPLSVTLPEITVMDEYISPFTGWTMETVGEELSNMNWDDWVELLFALSVTMKLTVNFFVSLWPDHITPFWVPESLYV